MASLTYAGFAPEQYLLGQLFTMPLSSGGRRAISIPAKYESTIIAGYTQLITGGFMAFWILIAVTLPRFMPRNLRRHRAMILISLWDISEPFQAVTEMVPFCWHVIRGKPLERSIIGPDDKSPATFSIRTTEERPKRINGKALGFAITVLILAVATLVGSVLGAIYIVASINIGHAAPVNPDMLFYAEGGRSSEEYAPLVYGRSTQRAVAAVDITGALLDSKKYQNKIQLTKLPKGKTVTGEDDYDIHYTFRIGGHEMGLQNLVDLSYNVTGNCSFRYDWYAGMKPDPDDAGSKIPGYRIFNHKDLVYQDPSSEQGMLGLYFDEARIYNQSWADQIPTYSFALLPEQYGYESEIATNDPWYHTEYNNIKEEFRLAYGRPPLECEEKHSYYLGKEYLGPSLAVFEGPTSDEKDILHAAKNISQRPSASRIPHGLYLILTRYTATVTWPVLVSLPYMLLNGELQSAQDFAGVGHGSAFMDIKRLVQAAYIRQRNILQDAALDYMTLKTLGAVNNSKYGSLNLLVDNDGKKAPGLEGFVIFTDEVTTLAFDLVVAVPIVVVILWITICVLIYFKRQPRYKLVPCDEMEKKQDREIGGGALVG